MKEKEPDLTEQIRAIFGTTDVKELRQIAEDAAYYRKKEILQTGIRPAEKILLQIHSLRISCVAETGCEDYRNCKKYHVSRQNDLQSDKTCA